MVRNGWKNARVKYTDTNGDVGMEQLGCGGDEFGVNPISQDMAS